MFRKIKRYLRDPYYEIGHDMLQLCPKCMSDKWWISVIWKMTMGYKLDWKNPKTLNEKLQWLKLYDRNPLYIMLVDKLRAKEWVAEKIGPQYVIPTLEVYNSVDEIDLDTLPNQFVLKCNHDSGSAVICNNKDTFDLAAAKVKLENALKKNYYWENREWAYSFVKPCIFAEKFLDDGIEPTIRDYKFWCFGGVPKVMYCSVKNNEIWENYFDMDFSPLDIDHGFPKSNSLIIKPSTFDDMKRVIHDLDIDISFIRIDFYEVSGQIYFGEFTLYDYAGMRPFKSRQQELKLGEMVKLPI